MRPGENVLNIPFGYDGQAMLWQQEAGFGFRMTGGYVSATLPDSVWRYPIVRAFYGAPLPPFPAQDLRALARGREVDVVLMRAHRPGSVARASPARRSASRAPRGHARLAGARHPGRAR